MSTNMKAPRSASLIALTTWPARCRTRRRPRSPNLQLGGAPCVAPPVLHCPDSGCAGDRVINQGPIVEMKTRRTYFLDYPMRPEGGRAGDIRPQPARRRIVRELAAPLLPDHGLPRRHRLVIATPNSPTRVWTAADDEYLQNIVNAVVDQIGKTNIKSFWLVGHSQGGMTSNRLLRTPFFSERADGWLSLSGGRLGGSPGRAGFGTIGPPPTDPGRGGSAAADGERCPRISRLLKPRFANCRRRISRSSSRPGSARWTARACRSRPRGRRNPGAARGRRPRRSSIPRPDTSSTAPVRIRQIPHGVCSHSPARLKFSDTRTAGMDESWPTSSGSRRDIPKDWSRR